MRRLPVLLAAALLLLGAPALAQPGGGKAPPPLGGGLLPPPTLADAGKGPVVNAGGTAYELVAAAGTGTVTSVGNGTVGALFSVSWATETTTPALSLNLAAQAANCVIAGPATGADAVPTCRALVDADLGSFTLAPSLKRLTLQDAANDVAVLTARASGGAGTAPIAQFQASDNTPLSYITHDGKYRLLEDAGVGKVLTSDANGVGSWAAGGGGITNSAGANVIPKSDGTNLVASNLSDSGTAVTSAVPLLVPDGTAAAPALTGATTNTGLSFVSAAIRLSTGGSAKLSVGTGVTAKSDLQIGWSSGDPSLAALDTGMRRRAAANPAWGAASATPVAYTHNLAADARAGTDTNTAGAPATLAPGIGTGTGGSGTLNLAVAPSTGVSGTTAGTLQTVAAFAPTSTAISVPTPVATTGASQAGNSVTITASPAVASTDTAGAAAGGSVNVVAGAAARNASGNANGGDIFLQGGAPIGTGTIGAVVIGAVGSGGNAHGRMYPASYGVTFGNSPYVYIGGLGSAHGVVVDSTGHIGLHSTTPPNQTADTFFRRRAAANPGWGAASATPVAYTHNLAADARAGTDADTAGATATIQPGLGTGVGGSGDLILSVAPANAVGGTATTVVVPQPVLTLAKTATTLTVPTPVAGTGASQAGNSVTITASPAVASTDTAGAAAGGNVTITAGAAARNTSGNADGGNVILLPGSAIGTGAIGAVQIGNISNDELFIRDAGASGAWSIIGNSASAVLNLNNAFYASRGGASVSIGHATDTVLRRKAAANPAWGAASAAPVAYTHSLAADSRAGTDTNTRGAAADLAPGNGTGTAGSGQFALQTAYNGSTGTTANTFTDRVFLESVWTDLTESSATNFSKLTYAASTAVGAEYLVTIEANDGTEYQSLTSRVRVSSVRKAAGNTVSTTNLAGTDLLAASSGTLTATFTVVEGADGVTLAANAVSSLTQTALRISYQAVVNGPGTVGAP